MKNYESLFTQNKSQLRANAFAVFFPPRGESFDVPFQAIAKRTSDGEEAWSFEQDIYRQKYYFTTVPKLRNYLNYTFIRLCHLEATQPGEYFKYSEDGNYVCFNSGLQDAYEHDLILIFEKFKPQPGKENIDHSDWVYRGLLTPSSDTFIDRFNDKVPKLAWYTKDSRDFTYDLSYDLSQEYYDHVFFRAKERTGMDNVPDSVVKSYLNGVLAGMVPKIKRNYKIAIPVYYIQEHKMQLLLPFPAATGKSYSAFLIERDDERKRYFIKTILDMDHAFFAARLITRPDEDWLHP